jgi:hypothetical protein
MRPMPMTASLLPQIQCDVLPMHGTLKEMVMDGKSLGFKSVPVHVPSRYLKIHEAFISYLKKISFNIHEA